MATNEDSEQLSYIDVQLFQNRLERFSLGFRLALDKGEGLNDGMYVLGAAAAVLLTTRDKHGAALARAADALARGLAGGLVVDAAATLRGLVLRFDHAGGGALRVLVHALGVALSDLVDRHELRI